MKNTTKETLISLAGLTERGWTKTMVEKMNLQVVKTAPNPHYKCAPPMKLYDLKTVKRKKIFNVEGNIKTPRKKQETQKKKRVSFFNVIRENICI